MACPSSSSIWSASTNRKSGSSTRPHHKISSSLTSTNTGWSQSNSNCGLRIVRIRRTREADMHEHDHQAHAPITHEQELTYYEKRVYAIQSLLVEKGVITADEV